MVDRELLAGRPLGEDHQAVRTGADGDCRTRRTGNGRLRMTEYGIMKTMLAISGVSSEGILKLMTMSSVIWTTAWAGGTRERRILLNITKTVTRYTTTKDSRSIKAMTFN